MDCVKKAIVRYGIITINVTEYQARSLFVLKELRSPLVLKRAITLVLKSAIAFPIYSYLINN
ncbi:MAG TPA: hypothetical protein V6C58_26255 [Allocoleopsis sp.]